MARMLAAGTTSIAITALLLIDSPYVFSPSHIDPTLSNTTRPDLQPAPLNDLPDLALKSMVRSDIMLENWNLPTWEREGSENNRHLANLSTHEKSEDRQVKCVEQNSNLENGDSGLKSTGPPPALLVRCRRYVDDQYNSSNVCLVDLHRHEKLLGWENGHPGFIKAVVEVDADHYNIFDINDISKVRILCSVLDVGHSSLLA